ncbi:TPA: AAA family ATPase [Aeromonas veronii]|nr:AAA family ATPase [Aeromonas veronii]
MRISKLNLYNFKKVNTLNVEISNNSNIICFVGENGSNKSSIINTIYNTIRKYAKDVSPSDIDDKYIQITNIIGADDDHCTFDVSVSSGGDVITYSETSHIGQNTISDRSRDKLQKKYGVTLFQNHDHFINELYFNDEKLSSSWSLQNDFKDPIRNNIYLYRPSHRFELAPYEKEQGIDKPLPTSNTLGKRLFPYKVTSGIDEATNYLFSALTDHFISTANNTTPTYSLYQYFFEIIRNVHPECEKLTVSAFPIRTISSQKMPSLDSLSAGQSDWLVTAFNILAQASTLISHHRDKYRNPHDVEGVVFIDEIDKNLHPKMQEEVLPWFTSAFPNIQFIITTHSPWVIRSLPESATVIKLPDGLDISDNYSYFNIDEITNKVFDRELGFSPQVTELIKHFESLFENYSVNHNEILKIYREHSIKSESLKERLKRVIMVKGGLELVEAINA